MACYRSLDCNTGCIREDVVSAAPAIRLGLFKGFVSAKTDRACRSGKTCCNHIAWNADGDGMDWNSGVAEMSALRRLLLVVSQPHVHHLSSTIFFNVT